MKIVPYLVFGGNAAEAITFYQKALKAKKTYVMLYKDVPPDVLGMHLSEEYKNKVMHAAIEFSGGQINVADKMEHAALTVGNNVHVHLEMENEHDIHEVFDALKEGGSVHMPVAESFWKAIYGTLTDKFGIHWSMNYQKEPMN